MAYRYRTAGQSRALDDRDIGLHRERGETRVNDLFLIGLSHLDFSIATAMRLSLLNDGDGLGTKLRKLVPVGCTKLIEQWYEVG